MQREAMEFDVLIVGGGLAGLASAIRLKQLARMKPAGEISVCLIEKGAEIGAHILSGAVMDPKAIAELFPNWKEDGARSMRPSPRIVSRPFGNRREAGPEHAAAGLFPEPRQLRHLARQRLPLARPAGGSDGRRGLCRFRGRRGAVRRQRCSEGRRHRRHGPPAGRQRRPGFPARHGAARQIHFFAEGCRGHLGKQLQAHFDLNAGRDAQTYGIGLKELWEIKPEMHQEGLVIHTGGWPLDPDTYGGGFSAAENNQITIGYVVGLGYENPYLSPYEEFQRFKTHPEIRKFLEGGKRIAYGARAIAAGGLQSLPKLTFPGGVLVGDDAGFLNASRIKGSHCAIKSGALAAEAASRHWQPSVSATNSPHSRRNSSRAGSTTSSTARETSSRGWPRGMQLGGLMFGIDQILFRGKAPWTLHHSGPDHAKLKPASQFQPINYPKPDGIVSFDRLVRFPLQHQP